MVTGTKDFCQLANSFSSLSDQLAPGWAGTVGWPVWPAGWAGTVWDWPAVGRTTGATVGTTGGWAIGATVGWTAGTGIGWTNGWAVGWVVVWTAGWAVGGYWLVGSSSSSSSVGSSDSYSGAGVGGAGATFGATGTTTVGAGGAVVSEVGVVVDVVVVTLTVGNTEAGGAWACLLELNLIASADQARATKATVARNFIE